MAVQLRHMRYFVAVAEELNFTRAAGRLHLAPQALSAAIRQLEGALGTPLFERTTRRVALTDAGAAFLPEARRTLDQADRAVEAARRAGAGEAGTVRIGFLSSTENHVLPALVRRLREQYPGIVARTEDVPIATLVERVRAGHLDAGITRPPLLDDPGLATEPLFAEPVAAVLPAGHRLASRPSLRLADLAGEPWALTERSSWPPWHEKYDRDFAAAGFRPDVVARGHSVQNLLALVAAGVGVTRLPLSARSMRDSAVAFVPLVGDVAEVVLLTRPPPWRPALATVVAVARRLAATTDLTSTA